MLSPTLSDVDVTGILTLVTLNRALFSRQQFLETKKTEIQSLDLSGLKNWMTTYQQVAGTNYFSAADIAEIDAFVRSYAALSSNLLAKILATRPAAPVPSAFLTLASIPSLMNMYNNAQLVITSINAQITTLTQKFEGSIDDLVIDKVYTGIGSGITVATKTESDIASKDIVGTRFTAVAGAGVVGFNLHVGGDHGLVEYQPFSYVAVKYYLTKVDKRVGDPYLEPNKFLKKWSVLGGWKIGGDLTYQGRQLSNVIGINPVLGFSYDFSRYISIDFMGIFYKKQSLNVLDTNPTLGLAPCISLSADFDLINRLKNLFTNTPYSVQQPKK
jgi:hypothetical protein